MLKSPSQWKPLIQHTAAFPCLWAGAHTVAVTSKLQFSEFSPISGWVQNEEAEPNKKSSKGTIILPWPPKLIQVLQKNTAKRVKWEVKTRSNGTCNTCPGSCHVPKMCREIRQPKGANFGRWIFQRKQLDNESRVIFPYYSDIFRDSYGSGMGIVWEAYHNGSHYCGSLKIPLNEWRIAHLRS